MGSGGGEQPRGRLIAIAVVALLAFGLGVYWFLGRDVEEPPVEIVEEVPEIVPSSPAPVEPEPASVEVPSLDESDGFVRNLIGTLSSHPSLAAWLVSDGIVRRFVVVVDNVADGSNPAQHVTFMRPESRFQTTADGTTHRVDPQSYRRYDLHAQIVDSLDTQGAADLYMMLEPLIGEAYAELGNPDRAFIQTLERAIISLLRVPVVNDPPQLIEYAPFFHYADERLESLTPAQKQLLGMGPGNVRTIQAKLRQLALAVGISDSRLP